MVDNNRKKIPIYDPASATLVNGSYVRTPFANNQIPQARFDTVSKEIIAYVQPLLQPNVAGLQAGNAACVLNNYISYGTSQAPNNKISIQGDQIVTSKQRVSFFCGCTRERDTYGAGGAPGRPYRLSGNPGFNRSHLYEMSYDYNLSPSLLNRSYSGAPLAQRIPTTSEGWKSKGIRIPNYPDCNDALPQVGLVNSEVTTWGVGAPNGSDNPVVEFRDDMTKASGPVQMGLLLQQQPLQRASA